MARRYRCRRPRPTATSTNSSAALDAESRAYLQELLAGAGEGLKNNGQPLSAALKRFDPTARDFQEISSQLAVRHEEIASSIHNFRLLLEAVGGKDKQLAELVDSSNAVFKTFAEEDTSVESTIGLLPGALSEDQAGSRQARDGRRTWSAPRVKELQPFAKATAPAEAATRELAIKTTPVFKNQIRPFARQILPVINEIGPATKELSEAFPKLASGFAVLNELFNEFAYNPGANRGGFLFFIDWANHNFNSAVSTADAHGPLGQTLAYFNCEVVPILKGVAEVNPTARLLLGLLNPPTGAACARFERENGERRARRARRRHERDRPARRRARRQHVRPEPRQRQAVRGRRRRGRSLSDAEARAHAGQHPRDRAVRAELLRAAAVPVGGVRRPAAAEGEGLPHGRCLPTGARPRRTVGCADLGRRRRPRGLGQARQGRPDRRDDRNRKPLRAAALEHARDPAPEDAAGGDLRAADPEGQRRAPTWPTAAGSPRARSNRR